MCSSMSNGGYVFFYDGLALTVTASSNAKSPLFFLRRIVPAKSFRSNEGKWRQVFCALVLLVFQLCSFWDQLNRRQSKTNFYPVQIYALSESKETSELFLLYNFARKSSIFMVLSELFAFTFKKVRFWIYFGIFPQVFDSLKSVFVVLDIFSVVFDVTNTFFSCPSAIATISLLEIFFSRW